MSTRIYLLIFAILIGSTLGEVTILNIGLATTTVTSIILALAVVKACLVALFFQHLKDEPRALSSLMLLGLLAAFSLISITFFQIHSHI